MLGSAILEVAIGLVFVYLLMSLICSAVNEIIEAKLKNRATDLEKGIRELFKQRNGEGMVRQLYDHPLINALFEKEYVPKPEITASSYWKGTKLPSYIPSGSFAAALIDIVMDPSGKAPSASPITIDKLRTAVGNIKDNLAVKRALSGIVAAAGDDLNKAREGIEAWFDGAMERVGGWYKRRSQWILLVLGLAISIAMNVNTLTIARHLWIDTPLRTAVVAEASTQQQVSSDDKSSPGDRLDKNRDALESLGLPIGWSGGFSVVYGTKASTGECGTFWGWTYAIAWALLGWLLTAGAVSFGAPFWFDLLNKFLTVRSTVKPQQKSREEASKQPQVPGSSPP